MNCTHCSRKGTVKPYLTNWHVDKLVITHVPAYHCNACGSRYHSLSPMLEFMNRFNMVKRADYVELVNKLKINTITLDNAIRWVLNK